MKIRAIVAGITTITAPPRRLSRKLDREEVMARLLTVAWPG